MNNTKTLFLLLAILFIAGILRFSFLGHHSLWFDEAFSIDLSSQNFSSIIHEEKNNPPLYHFLLHYWIKFFGSSEVSTRFASASLGIFSIFALFMLGTMLFGNKAGLLSSFLLAISPYHIHYSQEARMYSLVVLLTILSCLFFVKFLKNGKKITFIVYVLISSAAMYTHYFAIFIIIAQNVFIVIKGSYYRKRLVSWFLCQFLLVLLYVPWIWSLFHAIGSSNERFLSDLYLRIPYTLMVFNLGYSGIIIDTYSKHHLMRTILSHWYLIILLTGLIVPLFIFSLKALWQKEKHWGAFAFLYFCFPFILGLLVSLKIPLLEERYYIVTLPAYYLLLSMGILSLRNQKAKAVFIAGILFLTVFSLQNYYFNPLFGKGDWRNVPPYVETFAQKGDILVFYPDHIARAFNYYYHNKDLPEFKVSHLNDVAFHGADRIWLVISHAPDLDYKTILSDKFNVLQNKIFPMSNGIDVFLLTPLDGQIKQ